MPALDGLSLGLIILLAIVAYLFGAMYLYAPFKIRRNQVKDVVVGYQPIELPELPPEVAQAFYDASRGLVACGFHALGHLTHYTHTTGQNSYVSIWVEPSSLAEAQIIGVARPRRSRVCVLSHSSRSARNLPTRLRS